MAIYFKFDVLNALKEKGYNTSKLRKEKLLSESTIQKLRHNQQINWVSMEQICSLLDCQPGDFIGYKK